jgi:hypothetical protein
MKIIIEHDTVKREINGAFSVCGSYDDLRRVAREILKTVGEDDHHTFGWVEIHEPLPCVAGSKPLPWAS